MDIKYTEHSLTSNLMHLALYSESCINVHINFCISVYSKLCSSSAKEGFDNRTNHIAVMTILNEQSTERTQLLQKSGWGIVQILH